MHPAGKIIIGLLMIAIGLGLFVNSIGEPIIEELRTFWLNNFVVVVTGLIPIFLILIGLFIVWLEVDEVKATKEIEPQKKN